MGESSEKRGFIARLFSDDPMVSSQRIFGALGFVASVIFAALAIKAYSEFLWFTAVMFGVKEGVKGVTAFAKKLPDAPKIKQASPPSDKTLTSPSDDKPSTPEPTKN